MGELTKQVIGGWNQVVADPKTIFDPWITPDIKGSFFTPSFKSDLFNPSHSVSVMPASSSICIDPIVFLDSSNPKLMVFQRVFNALGENVDIKAQSKLSFNGGQEIKFEIKSEIEFNGGDFEKDENVKKYTRWAVKGSAILQVLAAITGQYFASKKMDDALKILWYSMFAALRAKLFVFSWVMKSYIKIEEASAIKERKREKEEAEEGIKAAEKEELNQMKANIRIALVQVDETMDVAQAALAKATCAKTLANQKNSETRMLLANFKSRTQMKNNIMNAKLAAIEDQMPTILTCLKSHYLNINYLREKVLYEEESNSV